MVKNQLMTNLTNRYGTVSRSHKSNNPFVKIAFPVHNVPAQGAYKVFSLCRKLKHLELCLGRFNLLLILYPEFSDDVPVNGGDPIHLIFLQCPDTEPLFFAAGTCLFNYLLTCLCSFTISLN